MLFFTFLKQYDFGIFCLSLPSLSLQTPAVAFRAFQTHVCLQRLYIALYRSYLPSRAFQLMLFDLQSFPDNTFAFLTLAFFFEIYPDPSFAFQTSIFSVDITFQTLLVPSRAFQISTVTFQSHLKPSKALPFPCINVVFQTPPMSSRAFQTLVSRGHICFPEPSRSKVSMFKNCQDPIFAFQTLAFPYTSFPDPL